MDVCVIGGCTKKGKIKAMEDKVLPCADKLAFDSEKEALDQARVIKWRHDTNLKAYKCRYCELWHLSSDSEVRDYN